MLLGPTKKGLFQVEAFTEGGVVGCQYRNQLLGFEPLRERSFGNAYFEVYASFVGVENWV